MPNDATSGNAFAEAIDVIRRNLDERCTRHGASRRETRRGWRWSVPPPGGLGIAYEIALDRDGVFVVVDHRGQHLDERRRQLIDALAADSCPVTVLRAAGEPVHPRAAGTPAAAANGDREAGSESMDQSRQNGRLTIIEHPDTQLATIDLAFTALAEQGLVYRRSRQLCYPDRSVKVQTRQGEGQQLSVQEIRVATLKAFLGEAASFLKRTKSGRLVPAFPSDRLCNQLLDHVGDRPVPLAPLKGVRTAPFLRPDGTICQTPGYDRATALFYDPCGTVFPPMPEITPENELALAKQAVERLARPYRGFIFDTSLPRTDGSWDLAVDTSRAIMISALPTLLSTAATRTRPGIAAEAPTFGSGKTLSIELPVIAALGDDPALISAEKEVAEDDLAKAVRSGLLASRGYMLLDNIQGPAARIPELTTLLTAAKLNIRLFFKQELAEIDNTVLALLSGNNMELNAELGRRILRARIDTGVARPDRIAHDFDPRAEVLSDRAELCIAALTLLRAYIVAGRPKQKGIPYGSFEEWARLVRDAMMWAGLPDIVLSVDEAFRDDTGISVLKDVIDEILRTPGMGQLAAFTAKQLTELANEHEIERTGGNSQTGTWTRPDGHAGSPPLLRPALHLALAVALNPGGEGRVKINGVTVGRWLQQVAGRWDGEGPDARRLMRVAGRESASPRYYCEKKSPNSEVFASSVPF
jgi:hypothetical protein